MELGELINEKQIFLDENFDNKEDLFKFIDEKAFKLGIINKSNSLFEALIKREMESSTAFDDGFAIPHGKSAFICSPAIFICRLKRGIEWESIDGSNVKIAIVLAIPENSETNDLHIKVLSSIARKLVYEDFRENMKNAKRSLEIINLLC